MGFITWHGGRERQKARVPHLLAALYPRVAGRQDSWSERSFIQKGEDALTGVAQWVGHHPEKPKVVASVPSQGTCLGCGPGLRFSPLSRNRQIKPSLKKKKKERKDFSQERAIFQVNNIKTSNSDPMLKEPTCGLFT